MSKQDISEALQHPRRSLGDRHRSQSEKYVSLALDENGELIPERAVNLEWGEQSARQAVLYDFTNSENWSTLVRVKTILGDSEGIRAVIEDLFTVLGRKPEQLVQLEDVDFLSNGLVLLEGSLEADPLDPDKWWDMVSQSSDMLSEFSHRMGSLDLRDRRANVLFSRRIERIRDSGDEEQFMLLSRLVLAQRPSNHEAWTSLGRMHERRGEYSDAWLCYDQAQSFFPGKTVRDDFKSRMEGMLEGSEKTPWSPPGISQRVDFLKKMEDMASLDSEEYTFEEISIEKDDPLRAIDEMVEDGRISEAFFKSRRLASEGVEGAMQMYEKLKKTMEEV
tara:strand:+ start:28764 stop:29765 length:1002 start_codon:yes stop_codon:yes gene_type:complete